MNKTVFNLFILFNIISGYKAGSTKFVKEAEIKHGRVAMISSIIIPLLDNVEPGVLGVNYVNSLDIGTQQLLLFGVGFSEFCQMLSAYEFPMDTSSWFKMKEDHVPGDYGFDPLRVKPITESALLNMKNKEINNGRLGKICLLIDIDHFRR